MLKLLLGDPNTRKLKRYQPLVDEINFLEENISKLTDEELRKETHILKSTISSELDIKRQKELLEEFLPKAFAIVREASKRVLDMRHFDVQLIGGMVLHECQIAEMKTGEGKTLVATLPCYLNALTGKGVHVVTVNDYLARRDAEWMGQVHRFLGLSVGLIQQDMNPVERKKNYDCDITYATNSELGFDYLRDNMKFSKDEMVQREHFFAIVDEIDSCLIDEARTPLIISGAAEDRTTQYLAIDKLIRFLKEKDYEVDEKDKNVLLTNDGINNIEKIFSNAGILKNNNFYDPENLSLVHHVNQALRANHLFQKGKDYIIQDDELKIIDELTGRILEGRRFGDGLHQALEAKERIPIKVENQTLASITYQNYFKLFKKKHLRHTPNKKFSISI